MQKRQNLNRRKRQRRRGGQKTNQPSPAKKRHSNEDLEIDHSVGGVDYKKDGNKNISAYDEKRFYSDSNHLRNRAQTSSGCPNNANQVVRNRRLTTEGWKTGKWPGNSAEQWGGKEKESKKLEKKITHP